MNGQNSRRRFFRYLAAETSSVIDEFRGRRQMRLSDLAELPEAAFTGIRPAGNPKSRYVVANGCLWERSAHDGKLTEAHRFSAIDCTILDCFDGRHTIAEICTKISQQAELSPQDAYRHVRGLFLALSKHMIFIPANLPE